MAEFAAANNLTGLEAKNLTYAEWIFTAQPGVFGLLPGWANPTGVALCVVAVLMSIGALPQIRRRGHFEVRSDQT